LPLLWRYAENLLLARTTTGRRAKPILPSLYLTTRCNYRCVYCDDGTGASYPQLPEPRVLDTAEVKRLLDIMRRVSPGMNITGGEPLLRGDIEELCAYMCKLSYFPVVINTNGLLLDRHLPLLHHVDYLVVSVDTLDDERSRALSGAAVGQSVGRVVENLARVADYQQRTGIKLQVIINTVVLPETLEDAWDVWAYCREKDFFWSPMPHVRGPYPNPGLVGNPRWEHLVDEVLRAKRLGARIFGSVAALRTIRGFSRYTCYPTTRPMIRPDGELYYPCGPLQTTAGNLLDVGDYNEAMAQGERLHGPVPTCDARCHVGCFLEGSLAITDPSAAVWYDVPLLLGRVRRVTPRRPPPGPGCPTPGRDVLNRMPTLSPSRVRTLREQGQLENDFTSSVRLASGARPGRSAEPVLSRSGDRAAAE
jgi:MoaA/NifB/PqqE/SkfB family radical SAM enzyme